MEESQPMRRKAVVILASVLVFALMLTACAVRRPLQTPVQPRQSITGQYDNNKGIGIGTGTATGRNNNTYSGMGQDINGDYNTGYGNTGYGNTGYGNYGGYNGMNSGYGNDYRNIGGSNNSPNFGMNNNGNAVTQGERASRILEAIPGVEDATVVISGNTAYVGVDTNQNLRGTGSNIAYGTGNDVSTIKQQCAQRIRSSNPNVQTVYVSTDANFLERLRRVGDGLRDGTAADRFRNELDELVRGLTPERQQ